MSGAALPGALPLGAQTVQYFQNPDGSIGVAPSPTAPTQAQLAQQYAQAQLGQQPLGYPTSQPQQQPQQQFQQQQFNAPQGDGSSYQPYPGVDAVGAADWSVSGSAMLGGVPNVPDPIGAENDPVNGKRQRLDEAALRRERITRGMPLRGGDCSSWVAAGGLIFFSQQSGAAIDGLTEGCDLMTSYAQRQTMAALNNLEALLATAGTSKERLIEVTILVCHYEDLESVQAGWAHWVQTLEGQLPAKSILIGPSTSGREGCRVEIKAVAKTA